MTATAGQASANVAGPRRRAAGRSTSYTVTPYIGSTRADGEDDHRLAAGDNHDGRRPDGRARPTRSPSKPTNLSGEGPKSAQLERRHADWRVAPGAPTGAAAQADSEAAIVRWTAPADDGGSPITGYTVTPSSAATAQTPVQAGASATGARMTGLTNGTQYTFTRRPRPTAPASAPHRPRRRRRRRGVDLRVRDAGDRRRRRHRRGRTSASSSAPTSPARSPASRFYKAAANTGTHVGSALDADRRRSLRRARSAARPAPAGRR